MSWKSAVVKGVLKTLGMSGQDLYSTLFGATALAPRKGTKELLEAYETMPWVRSIMGRISWSVSSVPWCLHVATDPPAEGYAAPRAKRNRALQRSMDPLHRMRMYKDLRNDQSLKEITEHPALELLENGNPAFPGQTCFQLTQQHLDLAGECLWLLDRSAIPMGGKQGAPGMPTAYWPVPPTWITHFPSPERSTFLVSTPRGGREVPAEDAIWFKHPRPGDPYDRGSGVFGALGDELETDEYAAKHLKAWFRNRARPDVLITAEGLRKEEVDRLEDGWLKKLSGAQGVNKPHFLNRKVQVDILSQSFQEMQMSQLRRDERDIIIHTIGMPPEILGIIENSNRSTIDAADYLFSKYVLVNRLEFIRIMLQIHLIEKYDPRLILDYISPVMEDSEFKLKVRSARPEGWNVDEWREFGGSAPLGGTAGKLHIVPFSTTAVESLDELADSGEEPDPAGATPPAKPGDPEPPTPPADDPPPVDENEEDTPADDPKPDAKSAKKRKKGDAKCSACGHPEHLPQECGWEQSMGSDCPCGK